MFKPCDHLDDVVARYRRAFPDVEVIDEGENVPATRNGHPVLVNLTRGSPVRFRWDEQSEREGHVWVVLRIGGQTYAVIGVPGPGGFDRQYRVPTDHVLLGTSTQNE